MLTFIPGVLESSRQMTSKSGQRFADFAVPFRAYISWLAITVTRSPSAPLVQLRVARSDVNGHGPSVQVSCSTKPAGRFDIPVGVPVDGYAVVGEVSVPVVLQPTVTVASTAVLTVIPDRRLHLGVLPPLQQTRFGLPKNWLGSNRGVTLPPAKGKGRHSCAAILVNSPVKAGPGPLAAQTPQSTSS